MISSIETGAVSMSAAQADPNREVVVALLEARGGELWGYARHLGLSQDEASDAVQETLLRLWAAIGNGSDVRQPAAWAFRTLQRICMDEHRWRRRVQALGERLRIVRRPEHIDGVGEAFGVWSDVERLPERQRLAIYLRYRADLAYAEIGAVLGIAPASARSHVSRALETLRTYLAEENER